MALNEASFALPLTVLPDLLEMGQDGYSESELLELQKGSLIWVVDDLRKRFDTSLQSSRKLWLEFEEGKATLKQVWASASNSLWLLHQKQQAEDMVRTRFPSVNIPTLQDVIVSRIHGKAPYSNVPGIHDKPPLGRKTRPILRLMGRSLIPFHPKEWWTKNALGLSFYEYFVGGVPNTAYGTVPALHCFLNCRDTCGRYFRVEGGPSGNPERIVGNVVWDQWDESPGAIEITFEHRGQFITRAVEILKSSDQIFPKSGEVKYGILGPNSNTYIAQALVRAGLPVRSPLGAFGWAYYDQGLEHPKNLDSIAGFSAQFARLKRFR